MIEARPAGLKPVAVHHKAGNIDASIHGAIEKLKRSLEHTFEKKEPGAELIEQIQKSPYSRDLIGYHGQPPEVKWPNNAKIAVQFVLNYEEGGEKHIEHGDAGSEQFLSEIIGAASYPAKHMLSKKAGHHHNNLSHIVFVETLRVTDGY